MGTVHLGLFMMLCFGVDKSSLEILQRQKRAWMIDSFDIDEGYNGPFPYVLGTIQVNKNITLFKIEGQGVDDEPIGTLKINEYTGEITVKKPVDREKFSVLKLKFTATDPFSHVIETRLGIEIKIIDSNDNAPKFDNKRYQTTINEWTTQGTDVITIKATDEDSDDRNKKIVFRIVSIIPEPHDLEFYLTQPSNSGIGTISFKGCLDYEKAERYTIIVEAKDHEESVRLSSSCTVIINIKDGNNHLPVITQQKGPVSVKEGQENVLVTRLQVTDKDTKGTEAWRAKYHIQGDTYNYFRITTDTETNEGLLYVQKQLNYEESRLQNVTITVENEIPYDSCKVISHNATGLWKVTTTTTSLSTCHVTVNVEDVNESPVFVDPIKTVLLKENVKEGQNLGKFTARDPDIASVNTIVYIKGHDPAHLVKVDSRTGNVTLSKTLDRESHFVKDNVYVVTILAIDNGAPRMTATATLDIHIIDENDNAPFLTASNVDICQSNGSSWVNITAVDLDKDPHSGPFNFKLHGDVKDGWKFDPVQGYSVNLVKENTVHSGYYELSVEVSDLQGKTAVHNLTVTVCSCLDTARPNCRFRKSTASKAGHASIGTILLGILVFAGMLLLALLVSCKKEPIMMPDEGSGQHLMKCNKEELGSDCKVVIDPLIKVYGQKPEQILILTQAMPPNASVSFANGSTRYGMSQSESEKSRNNRQQLVSHAGPEGSFMHMNSTRWSSALSTTRTRHERRSSVQENLMGHSKYSHQENTVVQQELLLQINKMLHILHAPGVEVGDYAPHVYAEEGDTENNSELDAISIPDISFNPDCIQDLDFRFKTLASICMPSENTASSKKNLL